MDDGEASSLAHAVVVEKMRVLDHDDAEEQIEVNMGGPIVLESAAYYVVRKSLQLLVLTFSLLRKEPTPASPEASL